MITRRWVSVLAAALSLGGCGADVAVGGEPYRPPSLPELRDHARAALARYDQVIGVDRGKRRFVPLSKLAVTVGELEPENEDLKQAVGAGWLTPAAALPDAPDPRGHIVWADGTTRGVSVISAGAALAAHRDDEQTCDACVPLGVTGARLGTMQIATTAGEARVPAWEFTLKDTALKVTYGAVGGADVVTVTPPPWDPDNSPEGLTVDAAATVRNSRQLTVSFVSARDPASEPCGADHHAEAIESANAVIVIVMAERRHANGNEICTMAGFTRTETVSLARPLAGRAVLDAQAGQPVGVTINE